MDEAREKRFMFKLRQALLMLVKWIEEEYGIKERCDKCGERM